MNASTLTALKKKVTLINVLPSGEQRDKVIKQVEMAIKNRLGQIALKKVA